MHNKDKNFEQLQAFILHKLPRRVFASGGGAAPRGRGGPSGGGQAGKRRTKKKLLDPAALEGYKAELREFRMLQAELGQWTEAFRAKHGRKPALPDVEATGAHTASGRA